MKPRKSLPICTTRKSTFHKTWYSHTTKIPTHVFRRSYKFTGATSGHSYTFLIFSTSTKHETYKLFGVLPVGFTSLHRGPLCYGSLQRISVKTESASCRYDDLLSSGTGALSIVRRHPMGRFSVSLGVSTRSAHSSSAIFE